MIVYFDAVRAKVRDEGLARNKAVYLRIGVTCAGRKEVLGLWIGALGEKYPGIVRSWRSAWDRVVPFFAFSAPIRRAIYTPNAIESLTSTVRGRSARGGTSRTTVRRRS